MGTVAGGGVGSSCLTGEAMRRTSASPNFRTSPGRRKDSRMALLLMKVPFVELRSRTRTVSSAIIISQWKEETVGSGILRSLVGFRPRLTIPLASSSVPGCVIPWSVSLVIAAIPCDMVQARCVGGSCRLVYAVGFLGGVRWIGMARGDG